MTKSVQITTRIKKWEEVYLSWIKAITSTIDEMNLIEIEVDGDKKEVIIKRFSYA